MKKPSLIIVHMLKPLIVAAHGVGLETRVIDEASTIP